MMHASCVTRYCRDLGWLLSPAFAGPLPSRPRVLDVFEGFRVLSWTGVKSGMRARVVDQRGLTCF